MCLHPSLVFQEARDEVERAELKIRGQNPRNIEPQLRESNVILSLDHPTNDFNERNQ